MRARLRQWLEDIDGSFWLRPGLMVLSAVVLAQFLVDADRLTLNIPDFVTRWLYSGGETGARTLLGAVAGSTIGVAGTVFSITIATLTLASSQMGPRLLRNFTQDRGNQLTLGIFLGTFAYAIVVLRSVRGADQGAFLPQIAITVAILLSLICVAMLVYFVNHVTAQINFDNVINLVYRDFRRQLENVTADPDTTTRLPDDHWRDGLPVLHQGGGYIQQIDVDNLADWACENQATVLLDARVGDHVLPGSPIALVKPGTPGAEKALARALVIGPYPTPSGDLEYAVEQLVDIALRALSPGFNDPRTAIRVLDRLGSALCVLAGRALPSGSMARDGRIVFQMGRTTYDGLLDAMFHGIRQSAHGSPAVLIHMMGIFHGVAKIEKDAGRRLSLLRHAELVLADARRDIANASDRGEVEASFAALAGTIGNLETNEHAPFQNGASSIAADYQFFS